MNRALAILLAMAMLLACVPALAEQTPSEPAAEGLPTGGEPENVAVANGLDSYRVLVYDPEGRPVEGAVIQFCDDATCAFQPTDADGVATFAAMEEKAYEVHVLMAPEGFGQDETVYLTLETYSDVTIRLERAE